jgi:DNA-binding NarL/FixJ family response regulator
MSVRTAIRSPARQPATGSGRSIRVLVAEGQALVRAGYRALLESEKRIAVVGEATSAGEAITVAGDTRPEVLVLDLALPGLDDLETTVGTVSHLASAGVAVMVTAPSESDAVVLGALRAGAVGVVAKDAEPAELILAIYALARGDALIPADSVRRLLCELPRQWPRRTPLAGQLENLTDRERAVVALVSRGLSNGEIAETLAISPATAKTHVSRAMAKLGARHRTQLVVLAYETGLVQPMPRRQSPEQQAGRDGRDVLAEQRQPVRITTFEDV